MDEFSELRSLGQIDSSEAGQVFRGFLRGQVRQSLVNIMAEEVRQLCGPKYHPAPDADCRRAGTADGVVLVEGRREKIVRPRVRRTKSDGSTEETCLETYASAREPGQLEEMLLRAVNFEVCRDLVSRLVARGFEASHGLLAVLDGADALKKAVLTFFDDAVIQRCLVHKERNIRGRLSKRDWGELARLFKRLREVEGEAAGREVYSELESFLTDKNAAALASFHEAGDELIALHCLNVPATLHVSLLSTNLIENSFRNTRRKLGRVTRFRAETDQASRWLAAALLEVEQGFRRLTGYRDLPRLSEALERHRAASLEVLVAHRQCVSTAASLGGASLPPSEDLNPYPKRLTLTLYEETIQDSTTNGTSPPKCRACAQRNTCCGFPQTIYQAYTNLA